MRAPTVPTTVASDRPYAAGQSDGEPSDKLEVSLLRHVGSRQPRLKEASMRRLLVLSLGDSLA